MSRRRKRWLYGVAAAMAVGIAGLFIAASVLSRRFEPFIREQAIRYMSERFNSDVEIAALHVRMPKLSPLNVLLTRGRGAKAGVEGQGISMRYRAAPDQPHLFKIAKFGIEVDLGTLFEDTKIVHWVDLEGMEINIPPKGERGALSKSAAGNSAGTDKAPNVLIQTVRIRNAKLVILPKDRAKRPLTFDLKNVTLTSAGMGRAMKYNADLTNPKPPGEIHSAGTFGPWATHDPSETPLAGNYTFQKADLGVFAGIAGILDSTGSFAGVLSSITAKGEATVPDFRLEMSGNRVPLYTRFEVLVDGTNGNTILKPVKAKLGSTEFETSGGVVKHEGDKRRSIDLNAIMPNADLRDVLRLAMKGSPFMEGRLNLKTLIAIPPLTGKVREKLRLDGTFRINNGKFLRSKIQNEIDKLARRAMGDPQNEEIDEVVSRMSGSFHLENEKLRFRKLAFEIPGAAVQLAGIYDMDGDSLDFTGTVKLKAKVSQTMTGWKRIALKPVDPFFAKQGAGTFLRISIQGTSQKPKFGLAKKK